MYFSGFVEQVQKLLGIDECRIDGPVQIRKLGKRGIQLKRRKALACACCVKIAAYLTKIRDEDDKSAGFGSSFHSNVVRHDQGRDQESNVLEKGQSANSMYA